MRLINNIIEPRRLLVIWQAPDKGSGKATGERFIVGEIINDSKGAILRYHDNLSAAQDKGFQGLTSFPYEADKKEYQNVVEVLSKRLPPESRSDYQDFLTSYRLPKDAKISPLTLLAYTTGRLAGDGFTFASTFEGAEAPFELTFDIAGFRHNDGMKLEPINQLQGAEVTLRPENNNEHDANAVAVYYNDILLGRVPRGTQTIIRGLLQERQVRAFIERINGTVERPNILVFVEVR